MSTPPPPVLAGEPLREQLASLAARAAIDRWDLGASCSTDTSVQVDRGEPKQMKGAERRAVTVRVWNGDGLVGITSTSDLTAAGLARALEGAKEASAFGNPQEIPAFSPLATAPLEPLDQPLLESRSILDLLARLKDAERDLLDRHVAITTVPYNGLAQRSSERLYINSAGALRHQQLTTASLYLYARAEEAGRKPRSSGAMRLAYGVDGLDVEGCVAEAAERTISHLDYAPIATGRYTCVFSPEAFLDLIGAFSSLFNARAVLDGVSLSRRESLGEVLAVPFLSIRDNGRHPGNIGASLFDGEGTPTAPLPLIEGGVLRNFLHSEATARAFGVLPTGHAGMGAKVSVSPDWLEIGPTPGQSPGQEGLDRFAPPGRRPGEGPLVVIDSLSALHAGVKASQGAFSLPFDGWLIQDGTAVSIEAATVAGDIRAVLQSLVGFEGPGKGEKLTLQQRDPIMHSIECRINAEDPYHDFRPSPGVIQSLNFPGGPGVRVDSHIYQGYVIPPYYDSMVAKLITFAPTRDGAIAKMRRALDEFIIEGIQTTIPFHRKMMDNPDFIAGTFDTKYLDTHDWKA